MEALEFFAGDSLKWIQTYGPYWRFPMKIQVKKGYDMKPDYNKFDAVTCGYRSNKYKYNTWDA